MIDHSAPVVLVDYARSEILQQMQLQPAHRVWLKDAGNVVRGRLDQIRGDTVQGWRSRGLSRFAWGLIHEDRDVAWLSMWRHLLDARIFVTSDNHKPHFMSLTGDRRQSRVVVVQSGIQTTRDLVGLAGGTRPTRGGPAKLIYDLFLCWGQSDVDRLAQHGLGARQTVVIGSILDALHEARGVSPDVKPCDIAVVLVKPRTFHFPPDGGYRDAQRRSREQLIKFLDRYCSDRRIAACFVLRNGSLDEVARQRQDIASRFAAPWSTNARTGWFSSYDAVMTAGVVVGDQSSLLVEALGRGRRVLSVNFADDPSMDFPVGGPWVMKCPTYEEFSERLDWVRDCPDSEWRSVTGSTPEYLVHRDPRRSAPQRARELVGALADCR